MLLDLWEWFLLINDGIDLVLSNLASGAYPVPFSFLLVILFFGLISYFAWRSTNIPDLPPAPRPPYVIQISATGPATGALRQTISDVRLLSGGFFDGNEIINRYRNLARNQATSTEGTGPGAQRNAQSRVFLETTVNQNNNRRGIPGRSFLLGLYRRPDYIDALVRPRTATVPTLQAQLTSSPNVVVYHRVNVYHHHIHSHPPGQNPGNSNPAQSPSVNNQTPQADSVPSQSEPEAPSTSTHSVPQEDQPSLTVEVRAEDNSAEPSPTNTDVDGTDSGPITGESEHNQVKNAFDVSAGASSDTEQDSILSINVPPTSAAVQLDNLENPIPSTSAPTMPADSHSTSAPPMASSSGGSGDGNNIRFIIKFLNDTQMDVTSQLGEKIIDFKRRHFATEMSENKTVRLIFNGRVLDNDNKTLREFGIFDQCVVHCLIVSRQQSQDQSRSTSNMSGPGRSNNGQDPLQGNMRRVGFPEPGMFFIAFIGVFLVFLWFICLHFGQHLFTQSAVVSLTVLTAIFLIGIVACYLPLPTN